MQESSMNVNDYYSKLPTDNASLKESCIQEEQSPSLPSDEDCQNVPTCQAQGLSEAPANPPHCDKNMAKSQTTPDFPSSQIAYHIAMPYPPLKVTKQNQKYASVMLDNMAGLKSEMTAVGSYFYSSLILKDCKEISETFRGISMVEMHHLNIFSTLAMLLGENPRLWSHHGRNGQYMYWNPACIPYPPFSPRVSREGCIKPLSKPEIKHILRTSIEAEQEAIRKYMHQASWIKDPCICDNLRRIAADEQMHVDIFMRLYHQC